MNSMHAFTPKCISIFAVSVAIFSILLFYALNYGCNLELEHNEMSCPIILYLAYSPFRNSLKIDLIYFASKWGLIEFNSTFSYFLDEAAINTTELFISPNLTNLTLFPVTTELHIIKGTKTYIYKPIRHTETNLSPALIYLHGGGGATGSPAYYDATIRYLTYQLQHIVIVPEYTKAPIQLYPDVEEECLKVARYILENGGELGVDTDRLSIAGDSYGGHVALYIVTKWDIINSDKKFNTFKSISLIYPSIQWLNLELESYKNRINNYRVISTKMVSNYISLGISGSLELVPYLMNSTLQTFSKNYSSKREKYPHLFPDVDWNPPTFLMKKYSKYADIILSPYSNFLFQEDLSYFPPTLIISAEYDILFTEGLLFKQKLEHFGVNVHYHVYEKMFHGFAYLCPPEIMFTDTVKSLLDVARFVAETV